MAKVAFPPDDKDLASFANTSVGTGSNTEIDTATDNDFPDDMSDMDAMSVFSYTTNSTVTTAYTEGDTGSFKPQDYKDPKVAVKEQRNVLYAKLLVGLVLLTAMTAMSAGTFFMIRRGEYNDFVVQFRNYASEIVAVSEENAANTFRSIAGLSVTITSYTESTKMKWPFITLPHFDARAHAAESLSGVRLLAFAPVVTKANKPAYEKYTAKKARGTFQESVHYQNMNISDVTSLYLWPHIYQGNLKTFQFNREEGPGPYLPMSQLSKFRPELSGMINYNLNDDKRVQKAFATTSITKSPSMNFFVITGTADSILVQPIFETVMGERKVVGILWCLIDWLAYFRNIAADADIIAVVKSTDNDAATYQIQGLEATFLGEGDLHDSKYDSLEISSEFAKLDMDDSMVELSDDLKVPSLSVHLYPTDSLRQSFDTNDAYIYTSGVISIFAFTTLVFIIFDYTVRRQQAKVMERVIKQDKIVSNLFPQQIRDRLYGNDDDDDHNDGKGKAANGEDKDDEKTNSFPDVLDPNDFHNPEIFNSPPIADLFPSATIFFADIAGFTAWSSQREPPQVFMLLESLYGAFDKIAYKHGIFKVETTGDCYVAVCGLPEPRKRHASAIARFAREVMVKFTDMTEKLEITLGPDTGDLKMRCGLHSGQVTAGVLRGERSRFQLFGDTVNTASRMETTAKLSCIQISSTTAELLRKEGKTKWVHPRSEKVAVKGKGLMQTCWLKLKKPCKPEADIGESMRGESQREEHQQVEADDSESEGGNEENYNNELPEMSNHLTKKQRLIEWNCEVLGSLLKQILSVRPDKAELDDLGDVEGLIGKATVAMDEFKEIVSLPKQVPGDQKETKDPKDILLPYDVTAQLRVYVTKVAAMYLDNPFHNFEHASHVSASVRKMLTRITSHNPSMGTESERAEETEEGDLACHSYGITADPLTQFAVIFSALIHDAEHPGVPNTQLVKEETPEAKLYKQSVAEQNSIHKAWDLLMTEEFSSLRNCIYSTEDELRRFRQLVINVVLATDICDKELGALRKARWATAFSEESVDSTPELDVDRKATIVIEHLIQASDVSHTMQHWQIYLHWNERFFFELYHAYKTGRAEADPTKGWYKGEIGFFDFYIIPLAKKLDRCGVFGVSSDEYLNYAQLNRDEWEREGEQTVEGFKAKYYAKYPDHKNLPLIE